MARRTKKQQPPEWRIEDARARFGELFRKAREEGPQCVRRRDAEAVVVLSAEEFDRLCCRELPDNLADFLLNSPLRGSGLVIERDPDLGRDVEL